MLHSSGCPRFSASLVLSYGRSIRLVTSPLKVGIDETFAPAGRLVCESPHPILHLAVLKSKSTWRWTIPDTLPRHKILQFFESLLGREDSNLRPYGPEL
jgi:hypothetical protein